MNAVESTALEGGVKGDEEVLEEAVQAEQTADSEMLLEPSGNLDRTAGNMDHDVMYPACFHAADPLNTPRPPGPKLDSQFVGKSGIEQASART